MASQPVITSRKLSPILPGIIYTITADWLTRDVFVLANAGETAVEMEANALCEFVRWQVAIAAMGEQL